MAGAYDGDMAGRPGGCEAARDTTYVVVQVVSPQGEKHPLKVRPLDDVATLRALCTQVSPAPWLRRGAKRGSHDAMSVARRCETLRGRALQREALRWRREGVAAAPRWRCEGVSVA